LIRFTCPCCGAEFPWEAGLVEADSKRLGAVLADMEPPLARAAMSYLRLFKPPKTALRLAKATKLLQELAGLVSHGTVCRDERTGVRRPAPASAWIAGIEQMLAQAERLSLPLANHNYLRQVVFAIADAADAAAEKQQEQDRRAGRHLQPDAGDPAADARARRMALNDQLHRIAADVQLGLLTPEEGERRRVAALAQHRGAA